MTVKGIFSKMHLLTLRRMLLRNNFAILAPVAVVYDGGGVYFGGASSNNNDGLLSNALSNVTAMAGIDDDPVLVSDCLLFDVADRARGCLCDLCDILIAGRYSN